MIHVVDDDGEVRESLRVLLEACGFVVETYAGAEAFLTASPTLAGCVLTDVCMPEIDGLELQRRLSVGNSRLAVIVMTGQADIPVAVQAMKAGAVDFLEKPFQDEQLLDAVRRALDESKRLRDADAASAEAATLLAALTPRERQVLNLLVAGLPTKAIANKLGTSPRTVEVHRGRVFSKLQAGSLPELVRFVLEADRQQWLAQ